MRASAFDSDIFEYARSRFAGALDQVYLDVASRSLIPASASEIAQRHLADRVYGRIDKNAYFAIVEEARERFARLIGAEPNEIAITKNVSEGLNAIASALPWKDGDLIVLCSEIEHPNNVYAWRNQERYGAMVQDIPAADGNFPMERVLEQLASPRPPRVVAVSATSFKPGFRTNLELLAQACEQYGVLLVVDGAQSVGVNHLDVRQTRISALAASTQKGLCALYGMGFLYVQRKLAEQLAPRQLARFGVTISGAHEADYDPGPITLKPGALRFDLGNYNFLAAHLANDSMQLIEHCGTNRIDDYVSSLAGRLVNGLLAAGANVLRPQNGRQSHIVCVAPSEGGGETAALHQFLQHNGVRAAVRSDLLRFSVHFYNNAIDIDRAIEVTAQWYRSSQGCTPT